eukprot:scaffold48357_cov73-Phaeocystis_antarctica.AAC.3
MHVECAGLSTFLSCTRMNMPKLSHVAAPRIPISAPFPFAGGRAGRSGVPRAARRAHHLGQADRGGRRHQGGRLRDQRGQLAAARPHAHAL